MNEEQLRKLINGNGEDLTGDLAETATQSQSIEPGEVLEAIPAGIEASGEPPESVAGAGDLVVHEVSFQGDQVDVIERDGDLYVAMKPICERLGIDWEAQRQLIQRDPVLSSTACMIQTVAQDGKLRQMTCLPLNKLNGWLFKLDVSRYEGEQRDLLIRYQSECYDALHQHFMIRPRQFAIMARQLEATQNQVAAVQNQVLAVAEAVNRSFGAWESLDSRLVAVTAIHERFNEAWNSIDTRLSDISVGQERVSDVCASLDTKLSAVQDRLDPQLPIAKVAHPLGLVRFFLIGSEPMVLASDFLVIHRRVGSAPHAANTLTQLGFRFGKDFETFTASEIGLRFGAAPGDVMTKAGLSPKNQSLILITVSGMGLVSLLNPGFYEWYLDQVGKVTAGLLKIAHRSRAQMEVPNELSA